MYRRRCHHLRALTLAVALVVTGEGCASAPPEDLNSLGYRERLEARIAAVDRDAPILLRFNPVRCGCPPLEARLDGRWHRAILSDFEGEAGRALLAASEADADGLFRLKGRLRPRVEPCGQASYLVTIEGETWLGVEGEGGGSNPMP